LGPVIDADWALEHMQRALWDPVDPRRLGSLADSLEFRVNGEVFRFADRRTLRRFMQTPVRWCGVVRDPVTGCRFQPNAHSPQAYWIGGPYFFEADSTRLRFIDDPHRYEIIRRK
jgi:YHS domain-containing protein